MPTRVTHTDQLGAFGECIRETVDELYEHREFISLIRRGGVTPQSIGAEPGVETEAAEKVLLHATKIADAANALIVAVEGLMAIAPEIDAALDSIADSAE